VLVVQDAEGYRLVTEWRVALESLDDLRQPDLDARPHLVGYFVAAFLTKVDELGTLNPCLDRRARDAGLLRCDDLTLEERDTGGFGSLLRRIPPPGRGHVSRCL